MSHRSDHPSLDIDKLLQDCVTEVVSDEDPDRFLAWFRNHLGGYTVGAQADLFDDAAERDRFAIVLGRAIWNAMPWPGNGLRPRPLPEPGRNETCFCGSGVKYKRCCARAPAPPPLDSDMLLPLVLEQLPSEIFEHEARSPARRWIPS